MLKVKVKIVDLSHLLGTAIMDNGINKAIEELYENEEMYVEILDVSIFSILNSTLALIKYQEIPRLQPSEAPEDDE